VEVVERRWLAERRRSGKSRRRTEHSFTLGEEEKKNMKTQGIIGARELTVHRVGIVGVTAQKRHRIRPVRPCAVPYTVRLIWVSPSAPVVSLKTNRDYGGSGEGAG
jgi:hypothetical protein